MRFRSVLLGALLLVGCLHAQNTLMGGLDFGDGWTVKVYFSDSLIFCGETGSCSAANGKYVWMHDRSPGSIYLDSTLGWGMMARTLAHEACHARQDKEGRPLDEAECERRGRT